MNPNHAPPIRFTRDCLISVWEPLVDVFQVLPTLRYAMFQRNRVEEVGRLNHPSTRPASAAPNIAPCRLQHSARLCPIYSAASNIYRRTSRILYAGCPAVSSSARTGFFCLNHDFRFSSLSNRDIGLWLAPVRDWELVRSHARALDLLHQQH